MKKEVNICDSCEKEISEKSCEFCKKDVCKRCSSYISIDIYNGQKNPFLETIDVCQNCYNNINKVNPIDFPKEFKEEIKKQMTEQLKKIILVKAFDKEPEPPFKGGEIASYMGMPIIKSKGAQIQMKELNRAIKNFKYGKKENLK